jgi:hypothetical protein
MYQTDLYCDSRKGGISLQKLKGTAATARPPRTLEMMETLRRWNRPSPPSTQRRQKMRLSYDE